MSTAENPEPQAAPAASPEAAPAEASLLDQILSRSDLDTPARDTVKDIASQIMAGITKRSKNVQEELSAQIADIDAVLTKQINEILHNAEFQKLEATWRGLHYLVHQSETGPDLRIEVLNASKSDLYDDISEAPDIDQTALWKKVYEDEYGTYGGEPFGVLMGDYEFKRSSQDLYLLRNLSGIAAAAHAPLLSAASPQLFFPEEKEKGKKNPRKSFTDLPEVRDLSSLFDDNLGSTAEWNAFRDSEDSRYVALAMPHVLMRLPYDPNSPQVKSFKFEEMVDGVEHDKYLWGNAAYALTARVTASFARHHWCSAIRGPEGGGLVEDLPMHSFPTDDGDIATKIPTELAITERFDRQLSELGFLPLVYRKKSNQAAFFGGQSAQKAKNYGAKNPQENASARLSAQIPYLLSTSRFAHYLKVMMRDSIGTTDSRKQIEDRLDSWIRTYTCDPSSSNEVKAQYPLSQAAVEVVEVEGKPGVYKAVAYLKPHFMLDQIDVTLSLVADLPDRLGGGG